MFLTLPCKFYIMRYSFVTLQFWWYCICLQRVTFSLLCQLLLALPFIFDGNLLFTYALFLALSATFAATTFPFNMSFVQAFNNFIRFQLLFINTLLMVVFTILYIISYSDCITHWIFSNLSFMVSGSVFSWGFCKIFYSRFLMEHQ